MDCSKDRIAQARIVCDLAAVERNVEIRPNEYAITLHALSADPGVTADMGSVEALDAVEAVTTIGVELSGTYTPEG